MQTQTTINWTQAEQISEQEQQNKIRIFEEVQESDDILDFF